MLYNPFINIIFYPFPTFCMSDPLWFTGPQHTSCSDGFVIWFISTYSAYSSILFYIKNLRNWQSGFLTLVLFNVTDVPGEIIRLSVNTSGVYTVATSGIDLYCCWSYHLTEYMYNFLIFLVIYTNTLHCYFTTVILQWWPYVVPVNTTTIPF